MGHPVWEPVGPLVDATQNRTGAKKKKLAKQLLDERLGSAKLGGRPFFLAGIHMGPSPEVIEVILGRSITTITSHSIGVIHHRYWEGTNV